MAFLQSAEKQVGGLFKGMPQMSKQSKESLVNAWPLIALVIGVLQLWAAWILWQAASWVDRLSDFANQIAVYTGGHAGISSTDKTIMYLGIILLVVDAVILLMAYPQLKARARRGWDLLFLGSLIYAVYAVVTLFMARNGGVGSFIFNLLGSGVGFYLLFQVRELYKGGTPNPTKQA